MRVGSFLLLILMLEVAGSGCTWGLAMPKFFQPSPPVGYQQKQAEEFDPYPEDSLGPSIAGGRPRGFDRPRDPVPLRSNPPLPVYNSGAAPYQLQPTPGPYSPGQLAPAPLYPQTQYVAPQYPAPPASGPAP